MNTSRSLIKLFEHLLKKQNVKKKTKQKVGKEKKRRIGNYYMDVIQILG